MLQSAQNGLGIALTATFVSCDALQAGSLVPVLPVMLVFTAVVYWSFRGKVPAE